MERRETDCLIRVEGAVSLASAAELKALLLEGLALGTDIQLDLEQAGAIDIAVMQIFLAAGMEADRLGVKLASNVSEAAAASARDAGFERFPDGRRYRRCGDADSASAT
jgi:anti-anti-sigma regulatory factor